MVRKEFTLHVRDDGRGIDREVLSGDGREGHFGLHGMRERAELVGGKLVVWSEVESGTEVELSIPASKAYTKSPPAFLVLSRSFQERHRCEREDQVVSSERVQFGFWWLMIIQWSAKALPYWSAPNPT